MPGSPLQHFLAKKTAPQLCLYGHGHNQDGDGAKNNARTKDVNKPMDDHCIGQVITGFVDFMLGNFSKHQKNWKIITSF